eukprot:s3045_g7.t1
MRYPSLLEQLERSADGEVRFQKPQDLRKTLGLDSRCSRLLNPPMTSMFNCCLSDPEADNQEVAVKIDARLNTNENERNDSHSPNSECGQKRRPSIRTKHSEGHTSEIHEEHDKDHLEWLNMSLKHLWPEMSEAARAVAVGKVLPSIKAKLLAKGKDKIHDVKFSEFTLGSQPVVLGPIQVSRMPRGSVRIRVLLDYRSDMHVEMELDTSYGRWCFGMRDFRIVGEMVTRVRPHIPDSPGTGSVSVFFVDPPKVDFTFSGNMSFGNFPFVKEAIRHSVDSLIAEMFVLPNVATQHISLTDLKMYPLVFSSPVPVGILRVTLQETVLESKKVDVASEEKSPSKKKPGIVSRMLSPFTKAVKGVLYAWEETEEFIERQVGAVIGVTTEPYMKWQLGQQVWMPDFKPGASFNFAMYDPEQHVKVSLWDRDLLSKDDLMGETTFQAVKAIFHSGERVPLIVPGEEDLSAGTFNAKIEFLVTSPGQNSSEGYLVVIRVREFLQGGSALKGKKLAMRAVFGEEQQITKAGAAMADITETAPAKAMLKKIEENMNGAGVDEEAIQKVLDLESVRQCRFAINRSLHFVVANHEIEEGEVFLHLVDMDIVQQKKGKEKKDTPRTPSSPRASETDEEVVAWMKISLKQLYEAEGLEIGGPFEFDARELGKIDVKMHVHLMLSCTGVAWNQQVSRRSTKWLSTRIRWRQKWKRSCKKCEVATVQAFGKTQGWMPHPVGMAHIP